MRKTGPIRLTGAEKRITRPGRPPRRPWRSAAKPGRSSIAGKRLRATRRGPPQLVRSTGRQRNDLRRVRVFLGQSGHRFIQRDDLVRERPNRNIAVGQLDMLDVTAVLDGFLPPGIVDEDATHGLGGGGEKMPLIVELLIAQQTQERLVDQGRRLEGLTRRFLRQFLSGKLAQLVIDDRQKLRGGARVAGLEVGQNAGYVLHALPECQAECKNRFTEPVEHSLETRVS